jgi:glyoxylase-like metal-dependent hydrolase (beta-lactamase superfamily II)
MKKFIAYASAAVLFVMLAWNAYTQNQPVELKINKIKDDLYYIEGDGGNVAVYITDEGVILIDDKFDRDHDQIMARVKSVTDKPIRYVINTHYHEDHSGGNIKMYGENVQIISTANSRANIVAHKQSNASNLVQPARLVFTDEEDIYLGGKEVRAKWFGRAHTNGDAIIYFPQARTIHTGDTMSGTSPLIDYSGGGSVIEWTKTIDAALKEYKDADTVIPGHGAITNPAGWKAYGDNIAKMRDSVHKMIKSGKKQEDIAKYMETEYKWAPGSLQQQWSVPGFMTELK